MKDNAFGIVKDDVINIPGRVEHEVGNLVVDFVQNVATDKNSSQESMSTGEGIGALAPSDNTATQVDY